MTRILGTELNLYNNQKFKAFVSDLTVNTPNTKVEKEIPAIIFGIKSWRFEKGKAPQPEFGMVYDKGYNSVTKE